MAKASKNDGAKTRATNDQPAAGDKKRSLNIRLAPVDNSDLALVSNYSAINVAPGMAFIDFGFLEPAMLAALQRVGQEGGTLPERLDGKLAVRVAMGYDAMHTLHQQLGRAFAGLTAGTGAKKASETQS
jgi:hypothetical protein